MLSIIQSQSVERLLAHLLADMNARHANGDMGVFDQYNLIVPSSSVKEWIGQQIAATQGICAMINNSFWGNYQWQLMTHVLDSKPLSQEEFARLPKILAKYYQKNRRLVPREAHLSSHFMQWRIFDHLHHEYAHFVSLSEKKQHAHPLCDLLLPALEAERAQASVKDTYSDTHSKQDALVEQVSATLGQTQRAQQSRGFWLLSKQIAQVFLDYLTHRPEWVSAWSAGRPLNISTVIAKKDALNQANNQAGTPDWLIKRYEKTAHWQQILWHALFADDFCYRQALFEWFWAKLHEREYKARLPAQITFFTLPPVPKSELALIRRLASYTDITFLHYNPSLEYWADISDPYWLGKHRLTQPELARLKESGHFLLARMGKQARDTFKLLVGLSGGASDLFEQVDWQDDFIECQPATLLEHIQKDVLLLQHTESAQQYISAQVQSGKTDDSIRINACHSLTRQLEVLREDIAAWLNVEPETSEQARSLSDVLVMLPDLAAHEAEVRAVFPSHMGADGLYLPAHLTGLPAPDTSALWEALSGYYRLLKLRLTSQQLFDWLMLEPVRTRLCLSFEQMQRGCELLTEAGFKRGFDAAHLKATFGDDSRFDGDERYTLRFALDRLVLGLLMPEVDYMQQQGVLSLPLAQVTLDDANIIQALVVAANCLQQGSSIHMSTCRLKSQKATVDTWLDRLMLDLDDFAELRTKLSWQELTDVFAQLRLAYTAFSKPKSGSASANHESLSLVHLDFVLDAVDDMLGAQMRGSEPTGAITFCRIGTVRPIPFKLVAVLNLNIGEYPMYQPPNYFNLMQAGLPEVGDRQREDDDTGAFLDAVMMARQACWFFYNGFSNNDSHEHLPANPLQELMLFLQRMYRTAHADNANNNDDADNSNANDNAASDTIPQHIAHPPLPFSPESFTDTSAQRHQGFWYDIYQALYQQARHKQKHNDTRADFIDWHRPLVFPKLPDEQGVFLDGTRLLQDLAKPAQHFLYSQQIMTVDERDALADTEPLGLDNLSRYQVRSALLEHMQRSWAAPAMPAQPSHTKTDTLAKLTPLLPVGVAKAAYFGQVQGALEAQLAELRKHTKSTPSAISTQSVCVAGHHITHSLPDDTASCVHPCGLSEHNKTKVWVNIQPTSAAAHHILKLWLAHLLWQVARRTTTGQVQQHDGASLWSFADKKTSVVQLMPVEATQATHYLSDWLSIWHYSQHTPLVLPPRWGLAAAEAVAKNKPLDELNINEWLRGRFKSNYAAEDTSLHPTWRLIFTSSHADSTALARDALQAHLHVFAERLYAPLLLALASKN